MTTTTLRATSTLRQLGRRNLERVRGLREGKFLSATDFCVFGVDVRREPPALRPSEHTMHFATSADDELIRRGLPPARQRFAARCFERGDIGVLAVDEHGALAGWVWLCFVSHRDPVTGIHWHLLPHECVAYDVVALSHKRAGIGSALALATMWRLHREGKIQTMFGYAATWNKPSIAMMRRAGFCDVHRLRTVALFEQRGLQLPFSVRPSTGPCSYRRVLAARLGRGVTGSAAATEAAAA